MNSSASEAVIDIAGLSRRFDEKLALDGINLRVQRGTVLGLVGANGAGKTTLIKHLLGLLRAESGTVRVFGHDPVADPVGVLGRIGYLSETRDLPGWMRIDELLRYSQAFYPKWDAEYAETLRQQFGLEPLARVRNLSRGETARAALLIALAHRPELLVLDEPSSGLDPVVRRDILEAIIHTISEEGRTVLFSSHLLDEVERVSDHLAMMAEGKLVLCGPLEGIQASHHHLTIRFNAPLSHAPELREALHISGNGREWTVLCNGTREALLVAVAKLGASVVADRAPSLDEIFVARAAQKTSA